MATLKGLTYEVIIGTDPADASPTQVFAPQHKDLAAAKAFRDDLAARYAAGTLNGVTVPGGETFCVRSVATNITVTDATSFASAAPDIIAAKIPLNFYVESGSGTHPLICAVPPEEAQALWLKYGV